MPSSLNRIRILLVDDHTVVRVGLIGIFRFEPDIEVVAEADSTAAAVAKFREHRPDVTLMDARMPGGGGIAAVRHILAESPEAVILMLTSYDTEQEVHAALEAGARGYILKDVAPEDLAASIRRAARGERCIPKDVALKLAERDSSKTLTAREIEVMELLAKGFTNRDIGRLLCLSEFTIKTHISHIYAKLEVADRAEAVSTAIRRGILQI